MTYVYRHIRLDKNELFYIRIGSESTYTRAKDKWERSSNRKNIVSKNDGNEVEYVNQEVVRDKK